MRFTLTPNRGISGGCEWGLWFGYLGLVIAARNLLEGALEAPKMWMPAVAFYSNSAFFLGVFVSVVLLVRVVTGRPAAWGLKPVIAGFTIIATVPIMDYVFSGGAGYTLAYPIVSPGRMFRTFPTAMGGLFGVSPGVRIEVAAVVAGSFLYSLGILRLRWWKALAIALGAYAIIFAAGAYPGLIAHLSTDPMAALRAGRPPERMILPPMETRFTLLVGIELLALAWLDRRRELRRLLGRVPVSRLLFYLAMPLFGMLLAWRLGPSLLRNVRSLTITLYGLGHPPLDELPVRIALTMGSIAAAYLFAQLVNDWTDRPADAINGKPNVFLPTEAPALRFGSIGAIALLWAVAAAASMGRLPLILFLATIAGAVLYSVPPIRLKRLPLVSSLTLSAICASAMIYGLALLPNYHVRNLLPENLPLVFALAFPLALQVKDLRDYAGDQSQRTWTLPTVLGPRIGRAVAAVLSAAGFLLIGPLTAQPVLAAVGAATAALVGGAAWLGKYERATQLAIAGCVILLALYLWLLPQN